MMLSLQSFEQLGPEYTSTNNQSEPLGTRLLLKIMKIL